MNDNLKLKLNSFGILIETSYLLLDINLRAFPYLSLVVLVLCLLEALTYPDFLNKHFIFNLLDILFLYSISGYIAGNSILFLENSEKNKLSKGQFGLLRNVYTLILPTTLVLIIIFYSSLSRLGTSLVFRNDMLLFPSRVYIGIAVIIYYLWVYYYFLEGRFKKVFAVIGIRNEIILLFIALLLWRLFLDFRMNYPSIIYNLRSITFAGNYTYEQKMRDQIGPVYDYYMFINKYTPDTAVIMHPKQQGRWGDVSNEGFTRYFIYHRNLVSEDANVDLKQKADFVMIIGDEKLTDRTLQDRWPDFNVAAKKIFLYGFSKEEPVKVIYSDYDHLRFNYSSYWGLIEVDKERMKW